MIYLYIDYTVKTKEVMKQFLILIYPSILTGFFFIQLYALQLSHYFMPNILLISFIYTLLYDHSILRLLYTALLIDILCFISCGMFGIASSTLILISIATPTIQEYLHEKAFIPCMLIILYQVILHIFQAIQFQHIQYNELVSQIIINSLGILCLYKISLKNET